MYNVKIGNKKIGYINEKQNINSYLNSVSEQKENVAFIDLEEPIEIKLELVNRNTPNVEEKLIKEIENNLEIQYTTYAITYNNKNVAYVSNMEEAESVITNVKNKSSNAKDLGILQVYSNNYDEIKAETIESSTNKVSKVLNNKKKTNTVKVAKTKKAQNIKGVNFTAKPLNGVITSRYGYRRSPGGIGSTNHKGLDISAKPGTTIKSAAAGTVKFAGYKGSLGNLVIMDNGNGVETYYAHCSKLYVKKGQNIKAGEKIAAVGQTGAATGPHLHLEIHVNGRVVNPQRYVY